MNYCLVFLAVLLCASFLHANMLFSRHHTSRTPIFHQKSTSELHVNVTELRGGSRTMFGSIMSKVSMAMRRILGPYLPKAWTKRGTRTGGYVPTEKRYGSRKENASASINTGPTRNKKGASDNNRIQKEIQSFVQDPPDNCKLSIGSNIRSWVVTLTGVSGTIYEGETFKLKMNFPKDYPSKPPSVYFLKPCPKHMHVYTNGDICLSILGKDWRPTMTAQNVAVSILSMLSSAKEKSIPQDNAMHADAKPGQRQNNWMYHDDRC